MKKNKEKHLSDILVNQKIQNKMQIFNNIERGKIANGIALHDFTIERPDLRAWTNLVVEFFRQYGIEPTRSDTPSRTATKNINFKNAIRKYEACNYNVEVMWIGALPPEHDSDMFCAIFSASIDIKGASTMRLVFDDNIAPFNAQLINKLIQDFGILVGARYGYFYQRDFNKGPIFYPIGILGGSSSSDDPDCKYIGKWGRVYRTSEKYKTGDLRDIYRINVISAAHLDRIIFGNRFEEWINSDPGHGSLTKLADNLWSWYVEDVDLVREKLRDTGMILCI